MSVSFEESLNYFSEYKVANAHKKVSVATNTTFLELTNGLHDGTLTIAGGGEATYSILSATRAAFDPNKVVSQHSACVSQLGDKYVVSNLAGETTELTEYVDILFDNLEVGEEYHMFTDMLGITNNGAAEIHVLDGSNFQQLTTFKTGLWVNASTDIAVTEVMFNSISDSVILRVYPYYSQPFRFKDIYFNLPYLGSARTPIYSDTKPFTDIATHVYAPKPSYLTISVACNVEDSYADLRPMVAEGIYNVKVTNRRDNVTAAVLYLDTRSNMSSTSIGPVTSLSNPAWHASSRAIRVNYVSGLLRLVALADDGKWIEIAPSDFVGSIELQCLVEF